MELNAKNIQRYNKKSIAQLIQIAQKYFNAYIRKRDFGQKCISCNSFGAHAGHYLSAGHNAIHRFSELNCHLQCVRCNMFLHGNLINYRMNLVKKIGKDKVELLEGTAKNFYKHDRFTLVEIILKYK